MTSTIMETALAHHNLSHHHATGTAARSLQTLEMCLVWEIRALATMCLAGIICYLLSFDAAMILLAVGGALLLVTNAAFCYEAVMLFLRPILEVLHIQAGQGNAKSEEYSRLQQTKWMTVCGVTLAVGSSTVLYVNGIALGLYPEYVLTSLWANPFVVGGNVSMMCNDIGMLLAAGGWKDLGGCCHNAFISRKKITSDMEEALLSPSLSMSELQSSIPDSSMLEEDSYESSFHSLCVASSVASSSCPYSPSALGHAADADPALPLKGEGESDTENSSTFDGCWGPENRSLLESFAESMNLSTSMSMSAEAGGGPFSPTTPDPHEDRARTEV
jgi:hypothetical protein